MKILFFSLSLLLALPAQAATVIELPVDGLACNFCVYGLVKKLNALPGVASADVSLQQRRARVVMEEGAKLSAEQLTSAVRDAGFTPGEPEYSEQPE